MASASESSWTSFGRGGASRSGSPRPRASQVITITERKIRATPVRIWSIVDRATCASVIPPLAALEATLGVVAATAGLTGPGIIADDYIGTDR